MLQAPGLAAIILMKVWICLYLFYFIFNLLLFFHFYVVLCDVASAHMTCAASSGCSWSCSNNTNKSNDMFIFILILSFLFSLYFYVVVCDAASAHMTCAAFSGCSWSFSNYTNINTTIFYFDGGYESGSEFFLKEFERAQKKCDLFLEGKKKYMK